MNDAKNPQGNPATKPAITHLFHELDGSYLVVWQGAMPLSRMNRSQSISPSKLNKPDRKTVDEALIELVEVGSIYASSKIKKKKSCCFFVARAPFGNPSKGHPKWPAM
jgi:hypothetical protein